MSTPVNNTNVSPVYAWIESPERYTITKYTAYFLVFIAECLLSLVSTPASKLEKTCQELHEENGIIYRQLRAKEQEIDTLKEQVKNAEAEAEKARNLWLQWNPLGHKKV
jgi:hypothetical protein